MLAWLEDIVPSWCWFQAWNSPRKRCCPAERCAFQGGLLQWMIWHNDTEATMVFRMLCFWLYVHMQSINPVKYTGCFEASPNPKSSWASLSFYPWYQPVTSIHMACNQDTPYWCFLLSLRNRLYHSLPLSHFDGVKVHINGLTIDSEIHLGGFLASPSASIARNLNETNLKLYYVIIIALGSCSRNLQYQGGNHNRGAASLVYSVALLFSLVDWVFIGA